MTRPRFTRALLFALTLGLVGGVARPASAQVFLSPIVGYNFGGDSGCPSISNCQDKNLNVGIAFGNYGTLFGTEMEFAYAKDFFGDVAAYESSVVTLMANLLLSPDVGRIKPYALIGAGLIKSNVEFGALSAFSSRDLNTVAWDLGGGVVGAISDRFGVRVDIRFIKALKDFEIFGVSATGNKLEFARIGGALLIFF
ncbi:MAG: outer membrane protein [Vicinamibacterales bacterium]